MHRPVSEFDSSLVVCKCDEFSEAVGETVPLEAVTYPDGMAGQVVWASENESVAIVRDGQVTGIGQGMTTITASIGDVVAKCTVYVG